MEQSAQMITIDAEKCTSCGACIEECPAGILVRSPDRGKGVSISRAEDCSRCGHCVAVCPAGAIAHKDLAAAGFQDIRRGEIDPDEMRNLLLARRSTRAFRDKPVPREVIEQLIEVATHAGTASNAQTEGFLVIQDRQKMAEVEKAVTDAMWARLKPLGSAVGRRLARMKYGEEMANQSVSYYERFKAMREAGRTTGMVLRGAPVVIAVHGRKDNLLARENCAIATRNMEMLAETLGLGTCWAGFLLIAASFRGEISGLLGLPKDRNIYSAIMLGYPKHVYRKTVPRAKREIRWI